MFMFEMAGGIILAVLSAVTLALLGVAAWASVLFAREAQSSDWIAAGEFTAILIVGLILYVLLRRIRQSRTADRPAVD